MQKMLQKILFFVVLGCSSLHAMFVGNFSDAASLQKGIFFQTESFLKARAGFAYDTLYKGAYKDKFKRLSSTPTNTKMRTYLGTLALNFWNRIDLYGMMGTSSFQIDEMIKTNEHFCWCLGTKFYLYRSQNFLVGIDGKYFRSEFHPSYFILEKKIAPLLSPFSLKYEEFQGALGLSYIIRPFIPYAGITYLYSTIDPLPSRGLLQDPSSDATLDFETSASINRKKWGLVIGTSLSSGKFFSLNIEMRFFNQNAIQASGEILF